MTATEYWKQKFDELPQTSADKLAVAMMNEFAEAYHQHKLKEVEKPNKNYGHCYQEAVRGKRCELFCDDSSLCGD